LADDATMSRLRVMHVVVGGDIGGAERLLADLGVRPEATGADHEVALITPNRRLLQYFVDAGLFVHDRGPARENPAAYLRQAFGSRDVGWIESLLRARRADIVHTHTFGSHVVGTRAALRAKLPQVRTEHHVMHYFDPSSSLFTRWAAARTDRFIAVSDYVRVVLGKTAPSLLGRTHVVRNGVDTDYWTPSPLPQGGFRVGVVCRLTPWKRVALAVEAAALASVDLIVVGEGKQRRALEALAARRRARVTFVGHQRDPRPFVAGCHVTLSTADREPLGLSVLESLSMGRPVIAFAGGGIPEIVRPDVTGWLVTKASGEAFAEAMVQARKDPDRCREMGAAARRFAEESGSIGKMCEGYGAVYRAASQNPRSAPGIAGARSKPE
jgi:glycosyltransferase involved in cell wall biosynthesis